MRSIAIIGSHGLYANYGGWDQLVNNLAENSSDKRPYLVFNPKETPVPKEPPKNVKVFRILLSASGYQGVFYDMLSVLIAALTCKSFLLLGSQGIPAAILLKFISFGYFKIVVNIGGVEWDRPHFGWLAGRYLKFCFWLTKLYADSIVIDNKFYESYFNENELISGRVNVIAYGGIMDKTIVDTDERLMERYPFLSKPYFLSISRSIEDNMISELCEVFSKDTSNHLVLISNLSNSTYGQDIIKRFSKVNNITLIDGLYFKPELDFIRLKCKTYIHTHTLCGSAPSLIEMIVSGRPIISIDIPQNRLTLKEEGSYFKSFDELGRLLEGNNNFPYCGESLAHSYSWGKIVKEYERIL